MSDGWLALACALFGGAVILIGIQSRGRKTNRIEMFFDERLPSILRNALLVAPLFGVSLVSFAAVVGLGALSDDRGSRAYGLGLFGLLGAALVTSGLAIVLASLLPSWVVPAWLREEQARREGSGPALRARADFVVAAFGTLLVALGIGLPIVMGVMVVVR